MSRSRARQALRLRQRELLAAQPLPKALDRVVRHLEHKAGADLPALASLRRKLVVLDAERRRHQLAALELREELRQARQELASVREATQREVVAQAALVERSAGVLREEQGHRYRQAHGMLRAAVDWMRRERVDVPGWLLRAAWPAPGDGAKRRARRRRSER